MYERKSKSVVTTMKRIALASISVSSVEDSSKSDEEEAECSYASFCSR